MQFNIFACQLFPSLYNNTQAIMRTFWDERFASEQYIYGQEPNVFFKQQLELLKPGRILLPGEGEGRNGVWAATQGWEVHAIDQSIQGKRKAEQLATQKAVRLHSYEVMNLADYTPNGSYFDAIALTYVHLPSDMRNVFHQKLIQALKPGGYLILEAFDVQQLGYNSGGPKNIDMLYTTTLLAGDFAETEIVLLEDTVDVLSEGKYHVGKAALVRLLARKPI